MIARTLILIALLAVPPLNESQRQKIAFPLDDGPRLEEPALHALAENVLLWEPGDEAGARVPEYDALLAKPSGGRGEVFLIEGTFAGRSRQIKLSDPGMWVDSLTEWVIIVRDDPEEVAVVYFVDPENELLTPPIGAQVRAAARFYKVWADTDADGNPARYLTFVARSAAVVGGQGSTPQSTMLPMLLLVVVLGVAYILIRRMSKPQPYTRPHSPDCERHGMLSDSADPDPAQALQRMAEQQDDTRDTGDTHGDR